MVHGCVTYIVEYGPRRKGGRPAAYSRCSIPRRSFAVYLVLTAICSAVSHSSWVSPAALVQAPRGSDKSILAKSGLFIALPAHERHEIARSPLCTMEAMERIRHELQCAEREPIPPGRAMP